MRERPRLRPEINVTPLVDVVLVLLIICMVITPQMEGPSVDLPPATHPDAEDRKKLEVVTVILEADGDVFLGPEAVTRDELPARIQAERIRRPGARVVIKADKAVGFGKVQALYTTFRKMGLTSVSLQVGDASTRGEG